MSLVEGIQLGINGIIIVFITLILIVLFIQFLSYLLTRYERGELNLIHRLTAKGRQSELLAPEEEDKMMAAAVAIAISACLKEEEIIFPESLLHEETHVSSWKMAGRLKLMDGIKR